MYNFKFNNCLSRGQLVSLNLDKVFLALLKILPCYEFFSGNLIFAIIARTIKDLQSRSILYGMERKVLSVVTLV